MPDVLHDLRYAIRTLARQPGFAAIAIFTLAVGIGANTAIYSVLDATLLRPLPFPEPDRLMKVSLIMPPRAGRPMMDDMVWSYPKYDGFRRIQQIFDDTALYTDSTYNLTGAGDPERIRGEVVSASYFSILGVRAEVGRTFRPEEDATPEKDMVAVISHGMWQRHYGSDPTIAGKTISLNLKPYTIVGVLPEGFQSLEGAIDVWVPIHTLAAADLGEIYSHSYYQVARLKRGVTVEQAKAEVTRLGKRVDEEYPDKFNHKNWGAIARTLQETRLDPVLRKSVWVLFGAVVFVLMIACVNIANLLLARGAARQREIAIRTAVGAGRARLVRQFLTESLVLAMIGALASLAVAWLGVSALSSINPATPGPNALARPLAGLTAMGLSSIRLDGRALLFTFGIALATGLLFGIMPAWQGSRAQAGDALKSGGRVAHCVGRNILVVVEVALAVVLLAGAGLMIKSFGRLLQTSAGVDTESVLTVRVNATRMQQAQASDFFSQLESRVAALPGVATVGLGDCPVLNGGCNSTLARFPDRPVEPGTEPSVGVHWASVTYFRTLKIPLLRGRTFTGADHAGLPKVVVINDAAARKFWPGEEPIGRRISVGQGGFQDGAEVIGIVGDVRYGDADEAAKPDVYLPFLQSPRSGIIIFARTSGAPLSLAPAIRREAQALNRDVPIWDIRTLDDRVRQASSKARFNAVLLAVFAAIALALAGVGIYGVMSYLVTQRTPEIGIRMALGARQVDVLMLVARRGAVLALAGVALGVAGALAATRMLATLLYQVKPWDPATYVEIALVLVSIAFAASYLPARRASSVDPSHALRAE